MVINEVQTIITDESPKYKLKAIIGESVKINNQWFSIGDKIGKYIITAILANHIVLSNDDKNSTLKFDDGF